MILKKSKIKERYEMKTETKLLIALGVFCVLFVTAIVIMSIAVSSYIAQNGLKSIVDGIWEGTK